MPVTYPNESTDYRAARDRLLEAEIALRAQVEEVARQRRALPAGGAVPEDYRFTTLDGGAMRLSELFTAPDRALLVYSFMFGPEDAAPCPMCTSMLDSLDGAARHVTQRADLAVVISGTAEQVRGVRAARGWRHLPLMADAGAYNRAYHGVDAEGRQMPMLNVFTAGDGTVRHRWGSEMFHAELDGHPRHVDQIWPLWNLLDLTPEGRGEDWWPALAYD